MAMGKMNDFTMREELKTWLSQSESDTIALGRRIGLTITAPCIFSLEGDLGAGKTQFVKGLASGLGIDTDLVSSPTFTLVHEYSSRKWPLFHFDFYRLHCADEVWELGWEDYLKSGICVVEWGSKFPNLIPKNALRFQFESKGTTRKIKRVVA